MTPTIFFVPLIAVVGQTVMAGEAALHPAITPALVMVGYLMMQLVRGIDWDRRPAVVLDTSNAPFYRWVADGIMNTCFNAVDRHVRDGRGGQPALIYDSPVTGASRTFSYRELLDQVARFAGVLRGLGVTRGDRVIIYLPLSPEAVVAMLACARIGAAGADLFAGQELT